MSTVSGRRAAAYTLAPRAMSSAAKRCPSPRLAPVTSAVIWRSSRVIVVMSMPSIASAEPVLYQTVNNVEASLFPTGTHRLKRMRIRDGHGQR